MENTGSRSDLAKAFAAFDINGDGTISLEEFRSVLVRPTSHGESPITAEMAAQLFAEMDKDASGGVDLEEFAAAWATDNKLLGGVTAPAEVPLDELAVPSCLPPMLDELAEPSCLPPMLEGFPMVEDLSSPVDSTQITIPSAQPGSEEVNTPEAVAIEGAISQIV